MSLITFITKGAAALFIILILITEAFTITLDTSEINGAVITTYIAIITTFCWVLVFFIFYKFKLIHYLFGLSVFLAFLYLYNYNPQIMLTHQKDNCFDKGLVWDNNTKTCSYPKIK